MPTERGGEPEDNLTLILFEALRELAEGYDAGRLIPEDYAIVAREALKRYHDATAAGYETRVLERGLPHEDPAAVERAAKMLAEADKMAQAIFDLRMHEGRAVWDQAEIARSNYLALRAAEGDRDG